MKRALDKPIRRAEGIFRRARALAAERGPTSIAVAVAENAEVLEAVVEAQRAGLVRALLFGHRERIRRLGDELGLQSDQCQIIDQPDPESACRQAVKAASDGEAEVLMKGIVPTSTLMRLVLDRSFNLRQERIISHVALLDIPVYPKLLAVTDGAMVVASDIRQRVQIVENAILLMQAMGVRRPRVALLAADDHVNLSMPVSCEAAVIAKMAERGQIKGAIVDGPLPLDLAVHASGKLLREHGSSLGGRADVLVVDNIESGNALVKSMGLFAQAVFAGIIVGARVPISLVSRADTTVNKVVSLAAAIVYAHHLREGATRG
jgi:phosphate butyryltransferase